MRTSRKLTHYLMLVIAVAMMSLTALAADPGEVYPQAAQASDQKAGSLLVYTLYESDGANTVKKDSKVNITNTNDSNPIIVHFFFVAASCSVADFKTELTANQTYSFLASEIDPDTTGYIIAIAENYLGAPILFNYLIGDVFVRNNDTTTDAYQVNLAAIAFSALWTAGPTGSVDHRTINPETKQRLRGIELPAFGITDVSEVITFNGTNGYDRQGATLALSNIPSRAANDRTRLIVISPRGSLLTGLSTGIGLFGLLFDDAEQSQSFQLGASNCQLNTILSNTAPRTVPRFESVIPSGRSGWMKIYTTGTVANSGAGILGSMISYNQQARIGFEGGHNLHHLTLTSGAGHNSLTVPIFPFTGN